MGAVYQAMDENLSCVVAVKELLQILINSGAHSGAKLRGEKVIKRNHQRVRFGVLFAVVVIAMGALAICPAILPASRALSAMNAQERGGTTKTTPTPTPKPATPRQSTATPRAGTIVRNQIGMELVYVPPGSFMMGSTNGDSDEKPVHQVTISQPFYIGRYEVTQAQWQSVMGTTVQQQRDKASPSWLMRGEGDNYPMYYVSWEEAKSFVQRLNALNDGYVYRLPTEAQWEYTCRAGTTGDYAGDLDSMAWYGNNSGNSYIDAESIWRKDQANYSKRLNDNGNRTHAVGTKQANGFGLYDMHGNLWEWCEDWYHSNYDGAPTDGTAWMSGGEQKYRVLRGGSWYFNAGYARSANRFGTPDYRYRSAGFRVVAVR